MKKENIQTRNRKQNLKRKDKDLGMQFASFIIKSSNSQQLNEATNNYLTNPSPASAPSNISSSNNATIPNSAYFQNAQFNFNLNIEPKFPFHSTQFPNKLSISNYSNPRNIFHTQDQKHSTSDFYLPNFSPFQNFPVFNEQSRSNYLPHSVVSSDGSLLSASGVAAVAAAAAAAATAAVNSSNQFNSTSFSDSSSSSVSPISPQVNYSNKKQPINNQIHYQHHQNHHLNPSSGAYLNLSSSSSKSSNFNNSNAAVPNRDFEQIPCY